MKKINKKFKSIRFKLFTILALIVISIMTFLIIANNIVLETYYLYTKQKMLKNVYEKINEYYNSNMSTSQIETALERIAISNNFDILISDNRNINVYSSYRNIMIILNPNNTLKEFNSDILYSDNNITIKTVLDISTSMNYIYLTGTLDNGYKLYIRIPITQIEESVKISNSFLYWIATVIIAVSAVLILIITRRFTEPIVELNDIAKKMSNLDFSKKYKPVNDEENEINTLGNSINLMSKKLEITIKTLRENNLELEKDIEEKSRLDEMRKSFISDVSHELKTPIALIQGYSEGLIENVNTDEESRKFYAEVILDETNKMDKLVKQLLELMKLEYGKREFNNKYFNIIGLENEIIRKSKVMLDEQKIEIIISGDENIYVFADDFYIEQVFTNYFTNAIKNIKEVDGKKQIVISNQINEKTNKLRVNVFNTGVNIEEENLARIWNRFYKVDESRNRENGGTGIGLSLVRAIMNNYNNEYGVVNKPNGVEFYFDLDLKEREEGE